MKIGVVGTGYVGLVSGTCFAEFGIDVICVDKDAGKIERLKNGIIPIYEPGLEDLVAKQVKAGRLHFTTNLAEAMEGADAVFIAVGTPPSVIDGQADLTYVFEAAKEIAQNIKGYTVIVNKSTVPVGTARRVTDVIRAANPNADFDVVSNPEFLREGAAIDDFMRPDRVVVGTTSERARAVMRELYRPLYINETPMVMTTPESSEIIKYASNAFLAVKITFINEIANLCEAVDGNVQDVAKGMGLDGRIGSKFLHAGPGYGGSCFPKDTLALVQIGEQHKAPQTIVQTVVDVNNARQKSMADRVIAACGGSVKDKKIAVLGIAFKPNTDDIREAPSLVIIPELQSAGAKIAATDPVAMDNAKKVLNNVEWCEDAYATIKDADAVVIVTEWNEFRGLNMDKVADLVKTKCIIDLRNIYKLPEMEERGFHYVSIGRPALIDGKAASKIRAA
ncbi:MAG: UDP-glucose 6-dehydrogenase [Alphaproteobacteria bacterium RIFCSPHIGHO2_12_FULL_45_9]|nr:MAG: UDP-glucose 6-dehydrogenase [Alphaproteobacteria bacterium RIFCSPHIGHO2_02_FULL_46_13]OFW93635.1 MAG: UDP-glucose 6-dehydrogenase [Alphaproteobacteria bacterium RIFCSPHIGHO2_12_FULL_45_9]